MTIEDRLRPQITLISPKSDGEKEYIGKWIGNPVTKEKKLGVFDSPRTKGTIVQDLEVKGDTHELTVYFDGADNDETAAAFWRSLDAFGSWSVIHPQRGEIENLYLSRAVWEVEPVRSVGFTTFNTSWIESLPDSTTVSVTELNSLLSGDIFDSIDSAVDQFVDIVSLNSFEEFNALVSGVNKAVNSIKKNTRKFENLQIINPRLTALFRGIDSTISSFPPDVSALAGQFVGLYTAIGLAQNSAQGAIDNMNNIVDGQSDIETDEPNRNGRNAAAVAEFNACLANAQISSAVTLPGIETRGQAIEVATALDNYLDSMIARLDATAELFVDTPIEDQYVPLSVSFGDQVRANRRGIQYLISTALDLKIERRFTTRVPRTPIEIAWTELDGPGEYIEEDGVMIDQNFANFCRWNDLHGNDILWLPAETEVRIFV